MLNLGLTDEAKVALYETLRSSHERRVRVAVLNGAEQVMHHLDAPASSIEDGEVTVDALADITRSLNLTLIDEDRALGFDAASPAKGALFADNSVAVEYGVFVDRAPVYDWIDVPVFWGPITLFERDAEVVQIEAQGKEALALDPHFARSGYTLRKGLRVDDAIRNVMGRLGERRYNLPVMAKRLTRNRAVQPTDEPWDVVKFGWESSRVVHRGKGKKRRREVVSVEYNGLIAVQGAWTVFYDGLGRLTARPRSRTIVATFLEGRDLITAPVPRWDVLAARNDVVVTGAKVTVGKKPNRHQVQRRGRASLEAPDPLSPQSLARHGVARRMTEFVEADNLKTDAACRARAKRVLDERSQDGLEVGFDALPLPMLEELDRVRVQTAEYALDVRLDSFTIPLTAEGVMRVGYDLAG